MIALRNIYILLGASLAGIPLMWILGHRANNMFLLFTVLFGFSLLYSYAFVQKTRQAVNHLAESAAAGRRYITVLVVGIVALVGLSLLTREQINFWNLDREDGLGTLFAGFLLAANILLAAHNARLAPSRTYKRKLVLLAVLFSLMTLDELSEYHHWLVYKLWGLVSGLGPDRLIEGIALWITLALPLIIASVALIVAFMRNVLSVTARRYFTAGLVFWLLALTNEALTPGGLIPHVYQVASEEFCEMLGAVMFQIGFLREIKCCRASKFDNNLSVIEEVNKRCVHEGGDGRDIDF